MTTSPQRPADRDLLIVAALASIVSLLSFLYYFQRGQILLYGDAVAHINIARRVFDSQTPGLLQLGTVWLPLPHLLMIPFLLSDWMWRTGVGGSIPSMAAYVFGVVGMFRLTRGVLEADEKTQAAARTAAWLAALVYGANPNLIYLQATAMTEALYLALFIWAVVFFVEFLVSERVSAASHASAEARSNTNPLLRCALCLAGAELTRYDGWFMAAVIGAAVVTMALRRWSDRRFRLVALKFSLAIAAAPALWLGYNAAVYGNPLEFANGPYSAKAIEQRTAAPGYPTHPGAGDVIASASYFLKSAQLNVARGNWGRIWIAVVFVGLIFEIRSLPVRCTLLLLLVPVVFYALSIAYSGVPLFVPAWWPFTWYNIRYGLQFLPVLAVSVGLIAAAALKLWPVKNPRYCFACGAVVAGVLLSYAFVWRAQPLCFTEAWINSRTRLSLESAVASNISSLPRNAQYLMYVGDHVGVFQQAGLPLRQVINEGNHRPWKRPSDAGGLWERALAHPSAHVDFVIAYDGDAVDRAVEKKELTLLTEIHTLGQPQARIYAGRAALNQSR